MHDIMLMGKNPNYLGSWDLYDVQGQAVTVTIQRIVDEGVINNGKEECCTVCYFMEDVKPMILNLTNKKMLAKLHKTKEVEKLVGKRITIGYEKVKAFGKIHDALRIKDTIPAQTKAKPVVCEQCGLQIVGAGSLSAEQLANGTKKKYGKALCMECVKKIKEIKEVKADDQV